MLGAAVSGPRVCGQLGRRGTSEAGPTGRGVGESRRGRGRCLSAFSEDGRGRDGPSAGPSRAHPSPGHSSARGRSAAIG